MNGLYSNSVNTVVVQPAAPFMLIPLAAALTGYSEKAIRCKISTGVWLDGREYVKAPDGHILISLKGFALWAEGASGSRSARVRSDYRSSTKAGPSGAPLS
jgi:hypothetical protein